ncbi:hypothetical protein H632_c4287p0 [Helicosporidium sp. ATCC 50920]|nr:hypothetical protein H632_c4287p0 [Helicosporidium sp. ATCC 50920]|eukprot:KDD71852.1 hypothetical protein H632_c4287p0 [Helicosporidium sp. ATCC 50920]
MEPEDEGEGGGAHEAGEAEPAAESLAAGASQGVAAPAPAAKDAQDEGSTLDRFAFISWLRDVARGSLLCATVLVHLCVAAVDPHIMEEAQSLADWLTETRHELHASPELLYDLRNTSTIVRRHLSEMGVSYK